MPEIIMGKENHIVFDIPRLPRFSCGIGCGMRWLSLNMSATWVIMEGMVTQVTATTMTFKPIRRQRLITVQFNCLKICFWINFSGRMVTAEKRESEESDA